MEKTIDERLNESLRQSYVTEEHHVYMTCSAAIEDIAKQIAHNLNECTGYENSGWYFMPDTKECTKDENISGTYSIVLRYINDPNDNIRMSVSDEDESPEIIIITVNKFTINEERPDDSDEKSFIRMLKYWLKHEFGHICQNYGSNTKNRKLVNNLKFINADIDTSLLNISPVKFSAVRNMMYWLSPSEIDQRCAELFQYLDDLSKEEIWDDEYKKSTGDNIVTYIIRTTDKIHLKSYIDTEYERLDTMMTWNNNYSKILLYAFYFKKYNLYKTRDKLDADFVEKVVNNYRYGDEEIKKLYAQHFMEWLQKQILNYTKKLYSVVYYNLYKRFWQKNSVLKEAKKQMFENYVSLEFINHLNEKMLLD